MAQEYDKYEYWRQFDDNSRWVGFVENIPFIKANEEEAGEEDDTITMLDYVLARTSAYSSSEDEEEIRKTAEATYTLNENVRRQCQLKNTPETVVDEKQKIIPIEEIEKKLGDTFDKLKQNC